MFRFFIFLAFAFNLIHASYCSEPSEPYCVSSKYTYESKYQFESCKQEVEWHLQKLERYAICVADESKKKMQDTVDKFNCYASGNSYCY